MSKFDPVPSESLNEVKKVASEILTPAATEVAKSLQQIYSSAESFSVKAPGQQCSLLGILMIVLAAIGEALDMFWFKDSQIMDNEISITLIVTGALLTVLGAAITSYFMMRRLADLEKQSEAIESAKTSLFRSILPR